MTVNAQTLLDALAAYDQATAHAAALQEKLSSLAERDVAIMDDVARLAATLDATLGAAALGEVSAEQVDTARAGHATAVEQSRGIDKAIEIVRERVRAHDIEIERQHTGIALIMKTLAEPLVPQALEAVEHHAQGLGQALGLLYRLDNAARLGGGFRSGEDAHAFAGAPGYVLSAHGMRAENGRLYPELRERIDDLRPAQLLALLETL